jgi:elongation factor Tu
LRTADITGKVELPENVKMVMPGDNVTAVFELISPVPLEPGMSKLIKERSCLYVFLGIVKDAP